MSLRAKDKEAYKKAWTSHFSEMNKLAITGGGEACVLLTEMEVSFKRILELAADFSYPGDDDDQNRNSN